jgi:hypothetical protein
MTRPYESPPDGEGAEAQTWELRVETCRIVLWRGYRAAAFYARPGLDQDVSLGEPSSSFRLRGSGAPQSDAARLAHRELLQRLTAEGWSRTGTGNEWYATELARPVAVPVAAEPADEAAPQPEPALPPVPERASAPTAAVAPPPPRAEPTPSPPERSAKPSPPEPRPAALPPGRRRRGLDEWQVLAATALVLAIFLLGWVAAHASAVGAVPPGPAPQQAPANRE